LKKWYTQTQANTDKQVILQGHLPFLMKEIRQKKQTKNEQTHHRTGLKSEVETNSEEAAVD